MVEITKQGFDMAPEKHKGSTGGTTKGTTNANPVTQTKYRKPGPNEKTSHLFVETER